MKKYFKHFMLFTLMVIVAAGLFGCTSSNENGETQQVAAAAGADGTGRLMPTPPGQFPIIPEGTEYTVTLGVMSSPMLADWNTNYLVQWVEERSGVNLEFIEFPQEMMS